ncbi:hypothetical protein GTA08_BOTSDO03691 [Botryosphaeria dothidea]|uniref:Uncharacterized protein n=1 Tax=Botryosphaeria dothidea TaxID=55169 RepID=A0A8H4N253_9PEZI|nr:hypothetical protein GTA08_BOTSDO03691 [Botryosphaeria dothidea]
MFFKRRSRANSYLEESDSPQSKTFEKYERPPSSRRDSAPTVNGTHESIAPIEKETQMYPRQNGPQETFVPQRQMTTGHNAMPPMDPSHGGMGMPMSGGMHMKPDPIGAPDLLTRAFNEAVRPYTDRIDQLESQVAELNAWIETLEQQRAEVHSWIDKRGLRPDVPPSIAKQMDRDDPAAAGTLNAQLDRKITIVNFDLHRLQDDLNDSISASHFASAMAKFLPDIARLASLRTGPRYAFDLILKLGGNLNSHGGLDTGDAEDIAARRDFYGRLDQAMVDVVRRRFDEGEDWPVQREIKRIEKTAAYLRNFGVEPYFPSTLHLMESKLHGTVNGGQGSPPGYT